jgi:hypothetical protein
MKVSKISKRILRAESETCLLFILTNDDATLNLEETKEYFWDIALFDKFPNELRDKNLFAYFNDDFDYVIGAKLLHTTLDLPDRLNAY